MARHKPIEPDDVSKRLFLYALDSAVIKAGSCVGLARKLGIGYRNLTNWRGGKMPTYADMQRYYFKFERLGHER